MSRDATTDTAAKITSRFQSSTSRQLQSSTQSRTPVTRTWCSYKETLSDSPRCENELEDEACHARCSRKGHRSHRSTYRPQLALQTPLPTPSAVATFTGGSPKIKACPHTTTENGSPGCGHEAHRTHRSIRTTYTCRAEWPSQLQPLLHGRDSALPSC